MLLPLRFGTPMPAGSNSASSSIMAALARRQDGQRDDEDYVWFWYTTVRFLPTHLPLHFDDTFIWYDGWS